MAKRTIGDYEYSLKHWPIENLFIIYAFDERKSAQGIVQQEKEVAKFHDEQKARDFLQNLQK